MGKLNLHINFIHMTLRGLSGFFIVNTGHDPIIPNNLKAISDLKQSSIEV